ncbi:putative adhesin/hemolysin precursor [Yersinia intermedia]|nr:putative adhesin/hemolysin precursor [Yersinia intermedia]
MANETGDPNAVGVSISLGSQKSKSESRLEQTTASGSNMAAGNNLSITATGNHGAGDIRVQGSELQAGKNLSLDAKNDIALNSAENSESLRGSNKSSGGNIGVGIGAGKGAGISIFAGVNASKGKEQGDSLTHTESQLKAGNTVSISSGRDTTLQGAQVSGETVKVDVGRDLTLQSEQDRNNYDSKQTSVSASGSFTFGTMTGSGSVSASKSKIDSDYTSVQEQTGFFAGKGGFDITVGEHTQLNGAVIGSTATADKNTLATGTLGFSDLDNQASFNTSTSSMGLSSGGFTGSKDFISNMGGGIPIAGGNSGDASSTTHAAVSDGTITIRNTDKQQQNVTDLSRDAEHANNALSPIFDKEKEQNRLREAQLIGDIGSQAIDIAATQGKILATNAGKAELEAKGIKAPGQDATPEERAVYDKLLTSTSAYKTTQAQYGTGSALQQGIQAATAAVQGLAGGNMAQALSGAAAPYLAEIIKQYAPDEASRVMAHAVLGAVVAQASGNSGLAGAAGAATSAMIGESIKKSLYGDIPVSQLSEEQKQTLVALGSLAAGLAGGLASGDTAGAVSGAQAGKNELSNNMTSLGLISQMMAQETLNAAAMAEAGKGGANEQAALALTKKVKEGLDAACLKNASCVLLAVVAAQSQSNSNSSQNPNIGKDLTDEQKKELGGSGSGTGTPPPPENDPNKSEEKKVDKLNQKQESAMRKIDNLIKNSLKDHDITGSLKDMDNNPIPKPNGSGENWNHMKEMQDTLNGLRNHANTLKNVNNPEAQAAYGRATEAINKIESAIKGYGI